MITWFTYSAKASYSSRYESGSSTYYSSDSKSYSTTNSTDTPVSIGETYNGSASSYYSEGANGVRMYGSNIGGTDLATDNSSSTGGEWASGSYTEIGFSTYKENGGGTSTSGTIAPNTLTYNITATTATTRTLTTSSTFSISVPSYTTAISTATAVAYSGTNTTVKTNSTTYLSTSSQSTQTTGTSFVSTGTTTYDNGDGNTGTAENDTYSIFTTTVPYTSTTYTTSSEIPTGWYDVGTVVSAEPNEWLWSLTYVCEANEPLNTDLAFISDLGNSFTLATFWPSYVSNTIKFYTYGQSIPSATFSQAASTTAFTINYPLGNSDTYTLPVTSGDDLARSTSSTTLNSTEMDTTGFTDGYSPYTYGVVTDVSTVYMSVSSTTSSTMLVQTDLDSTTTTISANTYVLTSYSFTVDELGNAYQASGEFHTTFLPAVNFVSSSAFQQGKAATDTSVVYPTLWNGVAASIQVFEKVPKLNGMYCPSAMGQDDDIGTNIGIYPAIYYPFTSSVLNGVVVPLRVNTTTTNGTSTVPTTAASTVTGTTLSFGYPITSSTSYNYDYTYTDVSSWSYAWSSYTLSYTSGTSYTSESDSSTVTLVSTFSTSTNMEIEGDNGGAYYSNPQGPYILVSHSQTGLPVPAGGFSPISTEQQQVVYFPGGRAVTSVDSTGGTTSSLTIVSSSSQNSFCETLYVEQSIPAYATSTGYAIPIKSYSMYLSGSSF